MKARATRKRSIRPELYELYRKLVDSRFSFVSRGEHHIQDIYQAVKQRFPRLCDDTVLCCETCGARYMTPEWQHRVRAALGRLKSPMGPVVKPPRRYYWILK